MFTVSIHGTFFLLLIAINMHFYAKIFWCVQHQESTWHCTCKYADLARYTSALCHSIAHNTAIIIHVIVKCKLARSSAVATITLENFAWVIETVGTFLILIKVVFSRILYCFDHIPRSRMTRSSHSLYGWEYNVQAAGVVICFVWCKFRIILW